MNTQTEPNDIFSKLACENQNEESDNTDYELDEGKAAKLQENYLFCRFHHLFEYEATYYSYLIAKLCSRKLFKEGLSSV